LMVSVRRDYLADGRRPGPGCAHSPHLAWPPGAPGMCLEMARSVGHWTVACHDGL